MRKFFYLTTLTTALCFATTAMAQTTRYSDRFPKLPPLRVDSGYALFTHPQQNWLQIARDSIQETDTVSTQSVMFRHRQQNSPTQYHYESRPDYTKMVDNLGGTRDWIVRKRRQNEGRPLQPLPPMRRR